jgi:hypothetical protein
MRQAQGIALVGLLMLLAGCKSSGELVATRNFTISESTKISVAPSSDPKGQTLYLENKMLAAGFDIAPYEMAVDQMESRSSATVRANEEELRIDSDASVSARTYLPTAVAIKLDYRYREYPAAIYYTSVFIRLIDLTDQRVLASYSVNGSEMRSIRIHNVIDDFVQRLQDYRR